MSGSEPRTTLTPEPEATAAVAPVEPQLLEELPTFELFFKTFGFKRVHGRIWGLLVLAGRPLAAKEIVAMLGISQGAVSEGIHALEEWGAVRASFDPARRCNLHAPVGNALSIVATVFRRREQVVFQQFKQTAVRSLAFVTERHGEKDPRVVTLRSIITTCEIAEALMSLVFSAVQNAMSDSESVLSRAIHAALKVGVGRPARWMFGGADPKAIDVEAGPAAAFLDDDEEEEEEASASVSS